MSTTTTTNTVKFNEGRAFAAKQLAAARNPGATARLLLSLAEAGMRNTCAESDWDACDFWSGVQGRAWRSLPV